MKIMKMILMLAAVVVGVTVSAATRYWNVADGDFQTASSWQGNAVPGGVGSVTTSVLIDHVVTAAERTLA